MHQIQTVYPHMGRSGTRWSLSKQLFHLKRFSDKYQVFEWNGMKPTDLLEEFLHIDGIPGAGLDEDGGDGFGELLGLLHGDFPTMSRMRSMRIFFLWTCNSALTSDYAQKWKHSPIISSFAIEKPKAPIKCLVTCRKSSIQYSNSMVCTPSPPGGRVAHIDMLRIDLMKKHKAVATKRQ